LGRLDDALGEFELAEELDPNSLQYLNWHALTLLMGRQLDEAWVVLERLRERDRAGFEYANALCFYYFAQGDFGRALKAVDRMEELRPGHSWRPRVWVYSAMGMKDEARQLLREFEVMPENRIPEHLAELHGVVGDLDLSFRYLNEAADGKQLSIQMMRNEPAFAPLRADPRFEEILRKLKLA
jgi:tetratricopeptide (TPR) repeat protein